MDAIHILPYILFGSPRGILFEDDPICWGGVMEEIDKSFKGRTWIATGNGLNAGTFLFDLASATKGSSVKIFEGHRYSFHRVSQFSCTQNCQSFRICPIRRATIAHFSEPNKKMLHVNGFAERLWAALPEPVKEFPWNKSEDLVLQQLLILGEKALKWCLIAVFIFSFLSDVIFAVVRNKELMVPLGLFIGCTMADFLKETSQELFQGTKEGGLSWHLLGIGSFFVLVKFVALYFTVQGQAFLSHVGNGGLMQVLWLWRKLMGERESVNVEILHQNTSKSNNVEG